MRISYLYFIFAVTAFLSRGCIFSAELKAYTCVDKCTKHGKLFLFSAASGAGKTTVVNALVGKLAQHVSFERVVTYATRAPRAGEVDGVDYIFISLEDFQKKIAEDFFINWSNAYGNYYGAPMSMVEKLNQGVSLIAVFDQTGVNEVLKRCSAVTIWLDVPSVDVLEKRLKNRGTEDSSELAFRISKAAQELASPDKLAVFKYRVVNDVLEDTVNTLEQIMLNEIDA